VKKGLIDPPTVDLPDGWCQVRASFYNELLASQSEMQEALQLVKREARSVIAEFFEEYEHEETAPEDSRTVKAIRRLQDVMSPDYGAVAQLRKGVKEKTNETKG
jgi:hypothetical protein